ncbi:FtsX-like permease family protein [Spiroplasma cantharicola]|uniref:ABC3 transporter permease C-terminal domain-containing protein n=1 Tax=Spiroplasma cantharicola TaxID=362837 RepID=A0A0M4JJG8_9MOLU|nr:FtsX-like permease family protein [Spiroplasma cantharicola]ALD66336.1 hypothetical protein SCANT_v1c04300 [Spiroplasma cantharicola]
MFRTAVQQVKRNWKISLSTFFIIFISSTFISTFLNIFLSTLGQTEDEFNTAGFAVIYFSMVLLISVIMVKITTNMNFELKRDQYYDLRILGFKNSQIRKIIFYENIIFILPFMILSYIISYPLSMLFIEQLKRDAIFSESFKLIINPIQIIIYILLATLFVLLLLFISTKKINIINTKKIITRKKEIISIIISTIISLFLLASSIGIYISGPTIDGATYLFGGLFLIASIAVIIKPLCKLIIYFLNIVFCKNKTTVFCLKEFEHSKNKLLNISIMYIITAFFASYSFSFLNFKSERPIAYLEIDPNEIYANGLAFLGKIIFIVVGVYSFAMSISSTAIFILENKNTYLSLMIMGYRTSNIIWHIVKQSILLCIITTLFSYIPSLFIIITIDKKIITELMWLWITIPIFVLSTFLITAISIVVPVIKSNKK